MTTLPLSCFTITPLSPAHRIEAENLTFPLYHHLLDDVLTGAPDLIALVVVLVDRPIGLALARIDTAITERHIPIAQLLSIAITPKRRRRGLGRHLLIALQDHLRSLGVARLKTIWLTTAKECIAFESLLAAQGWSSPNPRTYFAQGFARDAYAMPWVSVMKRLKPGLVIYPWVEVEQKERKAIEPELADGSIPEGLSPFYREDNIEPVTSLALFHHHQLVGWLINYYLSEDSIAYARQFVRPPFAAMGRGMTLVAHALERHCHHEDLIKQRPYASVDIPISFPRMLSIYHKYISPAGQIFFESMTAFCDLTTMNSDFNSLSITHISDQTMMHNNNHNIALML